MASNDLKKLVESLDPICKKTLEEAASLCVSRTHFHIEMEHWFFKLAEKSDADLVNLLSHFKINVDEFRNQLNKSMERFKRGNMRTPSLGDFTVQLLRESIVTARADFLEDKVRSAHLLYTALKHDGLNRIFTQSAECVKGIHIDALREVYVNLQEEEKGTANKASNEGLKSDSALKQYTVDMTQLAADGKIDEVSGRDTEVSQMIDILLRRRQNNPILVGEAGVGKTSVVEGLALKIHRGEIPDVLKGAKLLSLDMALLQAGAGIKGEFENRLKSLLQDVNESTESIILFIDEAHGMIGAGGQEGQSDAANILKPALARGELRTIAATTWAEYKKYFEKDAALSRRFQVVSVDEPTVDQAIRMMRKIAPAFAKHHGVKIYNEAIEASVKLSARYISGRQLPDKCISLLDTACSRVKLSQTTAPNQLTIDRNLLADKKTELALLEEENIQGYNQDRHLEMIIKLKSEMETLETEINNLQDRFNAEQKLVLEIQSIENSMAYDLKSGSDVTEKIKDLRKSLVKIQGELPLVYEAVDEKVIADVVGDWTGIPTGRMVSNEIQNLLKLEERLKARVVGQDHGLEAISEAIRSARAKLTDPSRPIGVFMLAGTSGVGKTETAMAIAEQVYGSEQNITTINMSEFKEEHKVSLLMGAPPGYVGYGEGGVLTEAVRRKPYSVVLLDEMEKAHPGVQDIFYQVFDKGQLKDGEGRDIDFRNTIIIMTSNAGTDTIMQMCSREEGADVDELEVGLKPDLLKYFKPAFLGRIKVIPYFPLGADVLVDIVKLQLEKLKKRFQEEYQGQMSWSDDVVKHIVRCCQDPSRGARNIAQILNGTIIPYMSKNVLMMIANGEKPNSVVIELSEESLFIIEVS